MERTLVILKPSAIQRELVGEVISRFERKGLRLCGIKMMQLDDEILSEHYAHIEGRPFFQRLKDAMMITPVIVCCWEGLDAVNVVRTMTGSTNCRNAAPGTIRGDFGISTQENIVHASDSPENAEIELARFFKKNEFFDFKKISFDYLYANDEV
ncbi:nucleoside-diphosphate kinase [Paludibacter sp. 221]|uniref:nucleoside-diphosphate kinase n=1 Tax=Paludibacter sp. 221 TaxID=2302939 RepID=UPI0013D66695|nr:nucleoside-diphosphate kinase [Paludibacter sp. 221]NDV46789.1 nucleoside-diphosphate kinase [Paludibacter sp. 221]